MSITACRLYRKRHIVPLSVLLGTLIVSPLILYGQTDNGVPSMAAQAEPKAIPKHSFSKKELQELKKRLKPESWPSKPQQPVTKPAKQPQRTAGTVFDRLRAALAVLADTLLPAAEAAVPVGTQIDLRVLVIAANGNEPSFPAITSTLDQAGIPYDTLIAASDPMLQDPTQAANNLAVKLYTGQHAHYQGVILTTGNLGYCFSGCGTNSEVWASAFTGEEWNALWNYEKQFGVRQATYYTLPGGWPDDFGLTQAGAVDTTATPITNATLTALGTQIFPYVNVANPITIKNVWTYLAKPVSPIPTGTSTEPLLTTPDGNLLAAIHTYADGRQNLALTMDNNPNLIHSLQLGYGVVNWVTKGLFLGERRVYLNAQVDDVLIPDVLWDPNCPSIDTVYPNSGLPGSSRKGCTPGDLSTTTLDPTVNAINQAILDWYSRNRKDPSSIEYRITGNDLQNVVNWQNSLRTRVPQAGALAFEFAFNGQGTDPSLYPNDALVTKVKSVQANFKWVNHTYSHPLLQPLPPYPNPITGTLFTAPVDYPAIMDELVQNDTVAHTLKLGQYALPALVTPEISGLDYLNAMRAALDFGIRYLVSDTSKSFMNNPKPNVGIWNYTATNQNILLEIPRHPTNLYYNVSGPAEWVSEYNYFYGPGGTVAPNFWGLGRDLTYAEILDKESDMWVSYLLKGDLDPIMFHQSNLRAFTYNGGNYPQIGLSNGPNHTLLGDLINATLTKYNKLLQLPIASPPMCCGPQSIGGVMERWTDNFLNRTGISAVYTQTSNGATITLSYVKPAATGTASTTAEPGLDPGYRPPVDPTLNPNPATSVQVAITGVAYGTGTQTYNGQTTSYVTVNAGSPVTLPVGPVSNQPPVAVNDSYSTSKDTALTVSAPGLLANDNDPDGDTLSVSVNTPPVNGTVSVAANGGFTYTPPAGLTGTDSFGYTISDGKGGNASATATITISAASLTPQTVFPTAVTITTGTLDYGTMASLKTSDGDTYDVNSAFVTAENGGVTDWYASTTVSGSASAVTQITMTYSGQYSKASVSQQVSLFNFATNSWDLLDTRTVGNSDDVTVTVTPANPSRYISSTGEMRARVRGYRAGAQSTTDWEFFCWANLLKWDVK